MKTGQGHITRSRSNGTTRECRQLEIKRELGINLQKTPFNRALNVATTQDFTSGCEMERAADIPARFIFSAIGGRAMEETAELMKSALVDIKEARRQMEDVANQITVLEDSTIPRLAQYIREIRSMRMGAVTEMGSILNEMRQVHKFFIDSSYEREMKELERFVSLCKEIQKLKMDGVFDAVCDSAIRLSLRESNKGE